MGADHQFGLAALDQGQRLAPRFGLLAADQPGGGDAQRLQPAHQFAEMLLGQNFGGGHQRALPAGVHADGGGQGGHHRLAGTHIALQQTVHGDMARQVPGNLEADALLGFGQLKRQGR